MRKTAQDHEDYKDLAECARKISELAVHINAKKKSFKKLQKMWMIHNKLSYPKSSDVDKLKRARDKRKVPYRHQHLFPPAHVFNMCACR